MDQARDEMKAYYESEGLTIYNGDCHKALKTLADCSVDSVVCDPPYELGFMGKQWDRSGIAYDVAVWSECLRVLKPGGHLLAFGGSRTYHRLACAIEDAGFEIRDQIQWIYGSGFPKSLDVSKAIDAAAGVERQTVGANPNHRPLSGIQYEGVYSGGNTGAAQITKATTEQAKQWNGWGTALKPAHEPIVLARKPIVGTVAENVLRHGTGGLNIDGCKVDSGGETMGWHGDPSHGFSGGLHSREPEGRPVEGRWPANVIHDGSDEVVGLFPETVSGGGIKNPVGGALTWKKGSNWRDSGEYEGDSGSAARFFYVPKADRREREAGLQDLPLHSAGEVTDRQDGSDGLNSPRAGAGRTSGSRNVHPTVKPLDLMRYLCRLVTPPNGLVLDPFGGSGSTGRAALLEGFRAVLIEIDASYCEIAARRCAEPIQESLFQPPRVAGTAIEQESLFTTGD